MFRFCSGLVLACLLAAPAAAADPPHNTPPAGFTALFNGKDLSNWQGLVELPKRAKMTPAELAEAQQKADAQMREHWSVENGVLVYDGKGNSLQTARDYGNFEFYVDWRIGPKGDSGIYLRGNPQVQIWDRAAGSANNAEGQFIGSGGLFNNQKNPSRPLKVADKPAGEWNRFFIRMIGDRTWIWLNDELVVDNTPLENYWERGAPLPATGPIELQHHGNRLEFRNIYVRELPQAAGRPSREGLVTFSVTDVPLQQVVQLLTTTGDLEIVVADPKGQLSTRRVAFMSLRDSPIERAIQQLCRAAGLRYSRDESGAYILRAR